VFILALMVTSSLRVLGFVLRSRGKAIDHLDGVKIKAASGQNRVLSSCSVVPILLLVVTRRQLADVLQSKSSANS
jgi:hypothetical protein